MKTCSVCQRCYEDDAAVCIENHGTLITESSGTRQMIENYQLDSLLERDAVGEIYLATNTVLDQPFVIRIIAQNLIIGAGEQARQMLKSEVRAASNFNHPNVARVQEFGSLDGGEFYIVTEAVGDKTLQEFLRNTGSLPEVEAVKIARQTAEALMAAHDAGFVHRSVSPANIVLTRDSQNQLLVKLRNFDFGGIKQCLAAEKSVVDPQIDTLRYLSPEQCDGKTVDALTDVYSLGIVLYEMLCGRSPFNAPTSAAIADRKVDQQPLTQLRFDVRALLSHVIIKSLQRRPAARLGMGNFARQLRHIALILLPMGEKLPAVPQVLLSDNTASDAPAITGSVIGENSPHEIITLDEVDTAEINTIFAQQNTAESEQTGADETPSLGELAPVFIAKNETETDLPAEEKVLSENEDANIDSFEPNPGYITQQRFDEVPSEIEVVQNDESAAQDMPALGELAPVFVAKNETETDSLPANSFSAESETANTDSFESNPIVYENPLDESPLDTNIAPTGEIVTDKTPDLGEIAPVFFEKNQVDASSPEPESAVTERQTVETAAGEPESFVVLPQESDKETRRTAESAAPIFAHYPEQRRQPRRPLTANRSALIGAGLTAVLISVMLGMIVYNGIHYQPASEQTAAADTPPVIETASETIVNEKNDTAEITKPNVPETENSDPITTKKPTLTTSKRPDQKPSEQTKNNSLPKQNDVVQEQAVRREPAAAGGRPQTELNSALDDWISATNSRNVEQQMNYYAPKLNAFYLTRNASQGTVRAEKNRVFSRADTVDIQTGKPSIKVSPDGQKATMRFRKKYAIKQGQQNRTGEVIQELQWAKTGDGWRIVSERDVKVINR